MFGASGFGLNMWKMVLLWMCFLYSSTLVLRKSMIVLALKLGQFLVHEELGIIDGWGASVEVEQSQSATFWLNCVGWCVNMRVILTAEFLVRTCLEMTLVWKDSRWTSQVLLQESIKTLARLQIDWLSHEGLKFETTKTKYHHRVWTPDHYILI